MIVVDASAIVTWILRTPGVARVEELIFSLDEPLHAPHLLVIEVAQVLRRFDARSELSTARGTQAIDDLAALDITYHSHEPLLPLVWRLRANLTACDAAYVALATALDAPLITFDARLAAAPGNSARIELLGQA